MNTSATSEPGTGGTPTPLGDSLRMDAMSGVLAENWWVVALRGVLGILLGLLAFFLPGATILSLVIVFSAYMLVDGIFTIVAAVRAAQSRNRWGFSWLRGSSALPRVLSRFSGPASPCLLSC
jgi:uncharacterized membrane protein HdeD (DUF308 family)